MSAGLDRQTPRPPVSPPVIKGTAAWLVPALAYVVTVGTLGVVTELALDDLSWQQVTIWTSVAYLAATPLLLIKAKVRPQPGPELLAALASGALAAFSLVLFFVALGAGEVSQVVPVTSAYPVVTLILAATLLRERVNTTQVLATALIIGGVVLLSVS